MILSADIRYRPAIPPSLATDAAGSSKDQAILIDDEEFMEKEMLGILREVFVNEAARRYKGFQDRKMLEERFNSHWPSFFGNIKTCHA